MIVEVYSTDPDLYYSILDFIEGKLKEEVASLEEKVLRTSRGMRLAVRNLKKAIQDDTRGGKEFFAYVYTPNNSYDFESLLYWSMRVELVQSFWCEDELDERNKAWDSRLGTGMTPEDNCYRVRSVLFPRGLVFDGQDDYLALRMLLRVN